MYGLRVGATLKMMHSSSSSLRPFPLSIHNSVDSNESKTRSGSPQLQSNKKKNHHILVKKSCCCGRRHFVGASGAVLLPNVHASASALQADPKDMLKRMYPPRPEWYEEFFACAMEKSMKPYEAEIAVYKADLFAQLRGKTEILELGIGTGPNLPFYARDGDMFVIGVDPNKSMEKYAQAAAAGAGLSSTRFSYMEAVGEALPVSDATMDAVIGTLVLCSVKDVKLTLQEVKRVLKPGGLYIFIEHVAAEDGTALRFIQTVFDPLQQILSDGCHLTRETGKYISQAGFSDVNINTMFLSSSSLIGPHVYGIASK